MSTGPNETDQPGLEALLGKTIRGATIEDKRIVIETSDGNRYFFYGFMSAGTGG